MHRTTFRINEEILAEAKALAARQHRSLNSVMEDALRLLLKTAREVESRPRVTLPTSGTPGAPHPTWEQIREILVQEDIERFLGVTTDDAPRRERPGLREQA